MARDETVYIIGEDVAGGLTYMEATGATHGFRQYVLSQKKDIVAAIEAVLGK